MRLFNVDWTLAACDPLPSPAQAALFPEMSQFLYVLAAILLSIAFRSFSHPVMQKLGSLCVLGASFLTGFFLSGRWEIGLAFASLWLVLPWLELVTRVRHLRMPQARALRFRRAPSEEDFPALPCLTEQLEEAGFKQVEDTGWSWDGHEQFLRLFYKNDESLQAMICMVKQEGLAFYYTSFYSRGKDGENWMTWNYPFSYALKTAPRMQVNRMRGDHSIDEMLAGHRQFLSSQGVSSALLRSSDPDEDEIQSDIQGDMEAQIAYNLKTGLLLPGGEGEVRYSWRGLFYIWLQFLRDFVRLN